MRRSWAAVVGATVVLTVLATWEFGRPSGLEGELAARPEVARVDALLRPASAVGWIVHLRDLSSSPHGLNEPSPGRPSRSSPAFGLG